MKFYFRNSLHRFIFFMLALSAGFLFSCSGNNSTSAVANDSSKPAAAASGDSLYYGKNSLKYKVDGRQVDIKDALKEGEGKYTTVLYVNKTKNDAATGMVEVSVTNLLTGEVFDLTFRASGSTTVSNYHPGMNTDNGKNGSASYLGAHSLVSYYGESVTINVTSLTATHIAASFSGKFSATDPNPATKEIADGSFDVVFKNE